MDEEILLFGDEERIEPAHRNKALLRDAWVNVQENTELPLYIPSGINEPVDVLKGEFERYRTGVPILDLEMSYHDFTELLQWSLTRKSEVVVLNAEFSGNENKFAAVVNYSLRYPGKIHLAGSYWDIFNYPTDSQPLLASVLMAAKLKSVSFRKAPPPLWVFTNTRGRPPKREIEKIAISKWIDDINMDYLEEHPQVCQCMTGQLSLRQLQLTAGTETCIIHHNLSCLNTRYGMMEKQRQERQRILQLPTLQPLLVRMGLDIGTLN